MIYSMIGDVLLKAYLKKTELARVNMCKEIICIHRLLYAAIYEKNVEQVKKVMEIHLDAFTLAGNRLLDK